jgi:hypothetical protein
MEDEGYPLSSKAQALIVYLIVKANKSRLKGGDGKWRFPHYITATSKELMAVLNISRRETLYSVRDELARHKLLIAIPGIGDRETAYIIVPTRPDLAGKLVTDEDTDKVVKAAKWLMIRGD